MGNKYHKTKGTFYVYDPDAQDYYKGLYRGVAQYTKYRWDAQEYKTVQGALSIIENLGSGFIVVNAEGIKYGG